MKVAVIKLGSRISYNSRDTSGGNGEARSIIKMLTEGGADVHVYTKILAKDNLIPELTWHNIEDDYESFNEQNFDALVILNGNVNFFGGAEDRAQILNYHIINNAQCKPFYIYCDPALTLKQLWPAVEKKPWGSKYAKKDIYIERSDITYLSQPFDVRMVEGIVAKNHITISKIIHYPFEKFPCLNNRATVNSNPFTDLSYGGTMRGGKREEKMIKFYFGYPEDISVEMFGKIELDAFKKDHSNLSKPLFTEPVQYGKMLQKMNEALAHVVIGDPLYEKLNDVNQRVYESVWSQVVTFIDSDFDGLRRVYGNDSDLVAFLYVKDRKDVIDRLRELKADPTVRNYILEKQIDAVGFNAKDYCEGFVSLLSENA